MSTISELGSFLAREQAAAAGASTAAPAHQTQTPALGETVPPPTVSGANGFNKGPS
jgi:hypothetical protein